jgi:hypothetical protein
LDTVILEKVDPRTVGLPQSNCLSYYTFHDRIYDYEWKIIAIEENRDICNIGFFFIDEDIFDEEPDFIWEYASYSLPLTWAEFHGLKIFLYDLGLRKEKKQTHRFSRFSASSTFPIALSKELQDQMIGAEVTYIYESMQSQDLGLISFDDIQKAPSRTLEMEMRSYTFSHLMNLEREYERYLKKEITGIDFKDLSGERFLPFGGLDLLNLSEIMMNMFSERGR